MLLSDLLNINCVMILHIPPVSQIWVRLLCVADKELSAGLTVSTHARKNPVLSEVITPACSFH